MNAFLSRFIRSAIGAAVLFTGLSSTAALAQASPSAHTFATRYDQLGRVTGTIAPDPDGTGVLKFAAARTIFDARSLPIRMESGELASWQSETVAPSAWAGFTILSSAESAYDVNRRKIKDVAKGSNGAIISLMQYSYDSFGRLDCTAVRMNAAVFGSPPASACTLGAEGTEGPDRVTKNVYDAAGQLLKVQKAVGTTLVQDYAVYTYTLNGKQQTVKDANANLAQYSYDGYDRQTRWTFLSKTSVGNIDATDYEEYGYDANSNRTSLRKRDGSVITYQYDALNRNTVKIVPERAGLAVTHTRDVYYGYDLRGLQTSARFDSASGEGLTTAYDGFGRMSLSTFTMDGIARTLSYSVDKGNNRTQLTFPDGNYFTFGYDGLDRMTVIGRNAASGLTRYVYNNRGSRDSLASGSYTYYAYDAAGRLTSINQDITGTANDVTYGLNQYNPASQVTQRSTSNDAYVWTGAVNVSRNYVVNGLNQYTSAGPATFTYDANGNLTSDGTNSYGYDVENRLIQASGATNATLRYDPLGRLYETNAGTVASTTRFLHDGVELVAEYNSSGVMLRRYVHGSGLDDPMAVFEGAGVADSAARLVKTNHQGSVVALTDWNGNLTAKNSYDEWGIPGSSNASIAAGGRFSYTGQAWIPELGMYYYKARIYSATLGRFMQTDPIGYEDGMNIYAYVANDPVNKTDPTGLCSEDWRCDGEWSDETHNSSPSDLGSYNDHFRSGNGSDYFVDPSESSGLEQAIDIGTQIQQSVANGGVMSGIANQAYANFASGPQAFALPEKDWRFTPTIASESGRTVGRFAGTITEGTMQVSTDGSYVVRGQMTLSLGEYNFNLDGGNAAHNAAIWIGGKVAGKGKTFVSVPTRTYTFTATGRYRR